MTGFPLLAGVITLLAVVGLLAYVVYVLRQTPDVLGRVIASLAIVMVAVPPIIATFAG
jgi:hypothetical protein